MSLGVAVASVLITIHARAFAAPDVEGDLSRHAPSFKGLDEDGDGSVTKGEAVRVRELTPKFDVWDRDKDGQLTRSEYQMGLLGRTAH